MHKLVIPESWECPPYPHKQEPKKGDLPEKYQDTYK